MPNPWDVGTARILAVLGFEALATTSAGLAFALGRRDGEGALSREDVLTNAAAIVGATPLPVSGDLENGFGAAPETAAETIHLAAAAGLVGASIEDATGDPDRPIYDASLAAERIAAAAEAARAVAFPFTLTARAENFLYGRPDLDDTIRRLQAFEAAGADVLYAPGLATVEEIQRVCDAVNRPVNVLARPDLTFDEIAGAGAQRVSVGGSLTWTAVDALVSAAETIRDRGDFSVLRPAPPLRDWFA